MDRWLVALVGEQMDEKWLLNGWVGGSNGWMVWAMDEWLGVWLYGWVSEWTDG